MPASRASSPAPPTRAPAAARASRPSTSRRESAAPRSRPATRQGFLQPARDRAVFEPAAGEAAAGIVEAQEAEIAPSLSRRARRLGRVPCRTKSAEPNEARRSARWGAAAKRDTPLIREFPHDEKLRLSVRQIELASDDATRGPRQDERRLRCSRTRGLGRAGARSQSPACRLALAASWRSFA